MRTKRQLPVWYQMFIKKKIKKLEIALAFLNLADEALVLGLVNTAKLYLKYAKR